MIARSWSTRHAATHGIAVRASCIILLLLGAGCASTADQAGSALDPPPSSEAPEAVIGPQSPVGRIDPDVIYYVGAAEILGQREQFFESARYYRRAAELSDDPEIAARALRVAAFANDEALTLAGVERWLELDSVNPEPHRFAAIIYLRRGDVEGVWEHLPRLLVDPTQPEAWQAIGQMLAGTSSRDAARTVFQRLMELYELPKDREVLAQWSDLAVQFQLLPAAEELATASLEIDPQDVQALAWRARIRHSLGLSAEAAEDYARAVELNPDDPQLRQAFAALLAEQRDFSGALEQLDGAVDTIETLYSRGLYAEAIDERERALGYYERLRVLAVEDESRRNFFLGQLSETLERPAAEVLDHYRAVTSGEHLDDAKLRSAIVLARDDQLARARVMLQKLQNGSAATAARAFQAEAALLREVDDDQEALTVYDRALALLPENTDLLFARALHAEQLDLIDRTEADLRQILALRPEDPNALNALGYTLTDRTDRHEEALALIEAAYAMVPDEPAIVDSMGWVHFKLGNLEVAREFLEKAMSLQADPEIAAHLGEVLWHLGREDEAREVWEAALADDPDAEPVLETRRRLLGE